MTAPVDPRETQDGAPWRAMWFMTPAAQALVPRLLRATVHAYQLRRDARLGGARAVFPSAEVR